MRRNKLVLRSKTSHCQKLPAALEAKAAAYFEELAKLKSTHQIPLQLIANMDETPVFFDSIPNRTIQRPLKQSADEFPHVVTYVQRKAWMDTEGMVFYAKEIVIPFVEAQREKLGLPDTPALFISDAFAAHKVPEVRLILITNNIIPVYIPPGTTSKLQPLDVSINKPLKQILRALWVEYMAENVGETIKPPGNAKMIEWIEIATQSLTSHPEMIKRR